MGLSLLGNDETNDAEALWSKKVKSKLLKIAVGE
ncbi:hypothetical protein HNR31_000512 [Anoxybacillus caldiproteolyticus]|uniref:Uncharacterized protein n=1 Tax=Thermaerobacillus caldiproteolyticus TaxID=247480 RepID=A0A7W0BXM8_9BACL|nr:hypothetical protein [Anoxybacillus caldiproteolyticus]